MSRRPAAARSRRGRCGRCSTASRASTTVMNSVMTAGLHHRWRERAADLAGVGPGDRALDVATGTGDLAIELRASRGGEVVGSDFSEGMLERARAKAPGAALGAGQRARAALRRRRVRRRDGRLRRAQLLRPRRAACARWRASCAPGGRVVVLEITTPTEAAAVDVLLALVRPRRAAARPLAGDRGLHVPAELGEALPRPARRSAASWRAPACATCAGSSPPAGSSRCTRGRWPDGERRGRSPRSSRPAARTCPG